MEESHSSEVEAEQCGVADVRLNIICSDGSHYAGNPLYFHSQLLRKKSKFFEALLSERWTSSSGIDYVDVDITEAASSSSHDVDKYIKCLNFMDSREGQRLCFSGVDEALKILSVASEWLFEDGIQKALLYLEAIPWTPNQKLQIQALFSSLDLNINGMPDLAARVTHSVSDVNLRKLKTLLEKMLSTTVSQRIRNVPSSTCFRNKIKDFIVSKFDASSPAPVPLQNVCTDALLKECRNVMGVIKIRSLHRVKKPDQDIEGRKIGIYHTIHMGLSCEGLLWLLDVFKLCHAELLQKALLMLCEDKEFARGVLKRGDSQDDGYAYLLDILNGRFMKYLAVCRIITPKSVRISFLTNWVPVIAYLSSQINLYELENRGKRESRWPWDYPYVIDVLKTLPPLDQTKIIKLWRADQRIPSAAAQVFSWWINIISMETNSC